jgi:hypothetical protein
MYLVDILQPQLAHFPTQLVLKGGLHSGGGGRGDGADGLILVVVAILLGDDGLGDRVEALACAYLVDEAGDVFLGVVENGLDERLEGRVARLEVVNVLFVDALAAVVRVGVVDAFGVVDGGAGGAGRCGAVTLLCKSMSVSVSVGVGRWPRRSGSRQQPHGHAVAQSRRHAVAQSRTLLFLFRQGTQALEMHLRFLLASSSSAFFFPRRPFLAGTCVLVCECARACASAPGSSMSRARVESVRLSVVVLRLWGGSDGGGEAL